MSTNLMLESLITARSEQNFMQMYRCPDYIDNNKKHEIELKKMVSSKF
jgi:hypothetical protein